MTQDELLKYAIKCGKLDLAQVQADYAMEEKRKIIEQHKYKIWEGKDGKWRTYLPEINNDKASKMRLLHSIKEKKQTVISLPLRMLISNGEIIRISWWVPIRSRSMRPIIGGTLKMQNFANRMSNRLARMR